MSQSLITALLWVLVPIGTMAAGGLVAAFYPPAPRWRSALQQFAAGTAFAVVSVEPLPDLRVRGEGLNREYLQLPAGMFTGEGRSE